MRQFCDLLTWLARTVLLILVVAGMQTSFAANIDCGLSSSMASPFPGNRVLDSGTQVGRTFFNGNLVVTLTACANTSSSAEAFTVAIPVDSTGVALPAASGVAIQSTALPSAAIVSSSGGTCTVATSGSSGGSTSVTFNHPGKTTCNYTVTFPLSLKMTASSNIAASGISTLSNSADWWASYADTSGQISTFRSSFDLISTACTLTTPNATVTLPTLSTGALTGAVGKTAGRTPFTVALQGCANGGTAYAAKATWTFTAGPADPASIANSADPAQAASNVYVQLLDGSHSPIASGGISTLAQVIGSTASSVQHYAQYYAGAATVGPGAVKGVVEIDLTYE